MSNLRFCVACKSLLKTRHQLIYCSNKCQNIYRYESWIYSWKQGKQNGSRGVTTKNISEYLKKYLFEKFEHKCFSCGWNKKHPVTGKIPLEVEHMDGNSENNSENNLQLLCPNCHTLTPFYKNLNKGNGRKWRMVKYIKST